MSQFPAIIAALPREVKGLVRGWNARELPGKVFVYTNDNAVVACAGMGAARARLAVEAALAAGPVTALVSVGLAGACDPALQVGDLVRAGVVVDSRTGERFANPRFESVVVTGDGIASVREKARLFDAYGAAAVDMEAAAVARLAEAHGLEFQAIKVISDGAEFELADLGRFATHDGQFRETAFALHAMLRPQLWSKLMQLASNSGQALKALTAALENELDWYRERV
ncbi:MAG TPA: phosphorylase [Granulicella sp.]|jgi:adenosylhomocysteine nucleosidase|nr:phosphorylase [Granulicella sp.]